jgi:hypothetical protein
MPQSNRAQFGGAGQIVCNDTDHLGFVIEDLR